MKQLADVDGQLAKPPSVRATTHLPHDLRHVAPRSKHGQALNAAELCKRLEALKKERRAAAYKAKREAKKQGQTSVPYHHVPQYAAKDFARTMSPEVQGKKESQFLSSSLPGFQKIHEAYLQKSTKRLSLKADCGLTDREVKSSNSLSVASKHTTSRSKRIPGLEDGQNLGRRAPRSGPNMKKVQHERGTEKSGHHIYESLPEADEGFQRLSTSDRVPIELATIESVLHRDIPVLAHKITRQHLEDRAGSDWTQSDICDIDSKYDAFKDLVVPFLRSLAKRGNVDNSTTAKSLSRRRSSFLARHS